MLSQKHKFPSSCASILSKKWSSRPDGNNVMIALPENYKNTFLYSFNIATLQTAIFKIIIHLP